MASKKMKGWTPYRNSSGHYVAWTREIAPLVELEIQEEDHGFEPPCDVFREEPNGHGVVLAVTLWNRSPRSTEMVAGPKYSGSLLGAQIMAKAMEKEWNA